MLKTTADIYSSLFVKIESVTAEIFLIWTDVTSTNVAVPPLYIPDPKLPKSDQKQTKFHSKSDLNQTNFDLFPDQIQEKQT